MALTIDSPTPLPPYFLIVLKILYTNEDVFEEPDINYNNMVAMAISENNLPDIMFIDDYDYLSVILEGEIPFFDKTLNKWVKKMDKMKEQESKIDEINQKIADAEAINIMNNKSVYYNYRLLIL